MWVGLKLIDILARPDWCAAALQAEKISSQNFGGLTACRELLEVQLRSLATNSHILFGVVALCLLTLMVIVIAGGRLSFAASKEGVSGNIGREEQKDAQAVGAEKVAKAADAKADEIKAEAPKFTPPPGETL